MIIPVLNSTESSKTNDFVSQYNLKQNSLNSEEARQAMQKMESAIKQEIKQSQEKEINDEKNNADPNKVDWNNMSENLRTITSMTEVFFQFEFDLENQKELILKIINKDTKEILNQFPSEVALKIAKMLDQTLGRGQIANATV